MELYSKATLLELTYKSANKSLCYHQLMKTKAQYFDNAYNLLQFSSLDPAMEARTQGKLNYFKTLTSHRRL